MTQIAVIGLGQFGRAIAKALAEQGAEVMALDSDEACVEQIKDFVAHAVVLDATDKKALESQNIREMNAVVVTIGENFEALLMTTVQLMEMGLTRVIARASNDQQRMILQRLGVKEILSPEEEVGRNFASVLMNPNIKSFITLPDGYQIAEVQTPRLLKDKELAKIDLRKNYELNLITIKRKYAENKNGNKVENLHIIGVPRADTKLEENDLLIILGKNEDIEKFVDLNK
jgi:trk system potassium uptake protein